MCTLLSSNQVDDKRLRVDISVIDDMLTCSEVERVILAREKISKFKRGSSFHIKIEIFGILGIFNMLNQMKNSAKLKNEPFSAQGSKKKLYY